MVLRRQLNRLDSFAPERTISGMGGGGLFAGRWDRLGAAFPLGIAVCLCSFPGCGGDDDGAATRVPPGGKPTEEIVVGINTTIKNTPIIIARELGLFRKGRMAVEIVTYQSGVEVLKDLFDGRIDIGAVPEHLAAFSSMNRSDFRILAVINRNRSNELVARRDRGIEGVGDLRGKTIGLNRRSSSFYWLYRLLIHSDLGIDDVTLVDGKPAALAGMLERGEVDAVLTWHPFAFEGRKALGKNAVVVDAQQGQDIYWLLLAGEDWTEAKGEQIEMFLQALAEAEIFIADHPAQAQEIVSRYLRMDPGYMDFEWPLHHFRLELPQNLILAMEQEYRWKAGRTSGPASPPNYLDFIYFDALSKIRPDAVDIVH